MQQLDIHRYDQRLRGGIRSVEKANISKRNKELIFAFQGYCVTQGLSKPRIVKYLQILKTSAQILGKDLDIVTKDDILKLVQTFQERNYTAWTKHGLKVMIKRFYKWLKGNDEEYPMEVKWINTNLKKSELRLPSEGDLLTEEEVKKLIDAAMNPRDKAFISLLYETGCRVGELGNLKILNIKFDKMGAVLSVFGKTGSRNIRVMASTPYLMSWLANHPNKDDRNSPLWISIGKKSTEPITYRYLWKMLGNVAQRASISKKINPHSFRHARATFLANHLTEFQMNQYFGWKQGSDMPSTYVHMSGKSVENAILQLNGIKMEKDSKESLLKPISCPRCEAVNPAESRYCCKCAGLLDVREAMEIEAREKEQQKIKGEVDNLMTKLLKDPEVIHILAEKISGLVPNG